jgi:hypothetical protein
MVLFRGPVLLAQGFYSSIPPPLSAQAVSVSVKGPLDFASVFTTTVLTPYKIDWQ